jgi:hypothetical protein
MAHNNATDTPDESVGKGASNRVGHLVGWVVLGILLGLLLVALFFAYGQPELLLEQMNLRYCG